MDQGETAILEVFTRRGDVLVTLGTGNNNRAGRRRRKSSRKKDSRGWIVMKSVAVGMQVMHHFAVIWASNNDVGESRTLLVVTDRQYENLVKLTKGFGSEVDFCNDQVGWGERTNLWRCTRNNIACCFS